MSGNSKENEKKKIRDHWEETSSEYQEGREVDFDTVYWGGKGYPSEEDLNLLGDVKGKDILEVGCGAGEISIALALKGADCTGIDISKEQLALARKRAEERNVDVDFIQGDFEEMEEIDDKSKDLVVSVFALDWAQDIRKVFSDVHRILRKGGIFVFTVQHPFYNCFSEPDEEFELKHSYFKRETRDEGIHFNIFTVGDLVNGLIETGFEVERVVEPEPLEEEFPEGKRHGLEKMKMIPYPFTVKVSEPERNL